MKKLLLNFVESWYAVERMMLCMRQCITETEKFQMKVRLKRHVDYTSYKEVQEKAIPKFKYYTMMICGIEERYWMKKLSLYDTHSIIIIKIHVTCLYQRK